MISNERPSPYGRRPFGSGQYSNLQPKPRVIEDTLAQKELFIERKTFTFTLKENPRGRFLRIIESNGTRSTSVIVPSTGIKEFQQILADMVKAAAEMPTKPGPAQPPQQ